MSLLYAVTLQPVINGSSDKYAEDVGEFQNVLTQWGTAHPTGYPLYALTGASTASLLRLFGVPAATAASAYSLLTMVLALTGVYVLLVWSDVWPSLAAFTAAILGLVFPFWYHASVAEVYSLLMGLIVLALLIALRWRMDRRTHHLYELAFVSGLAVGHHRLAVLMALPLLVLIWPVLWSALRERPLRILGALLCLCASFLIYLYLPLRSAAGGTWIYGRPARLCATIISSIRRPIGLSSSSRSVCILRMPPETFRVLADKLFHFADLFTRLSALLAYATHRTWPSEKRCISR